MKICPVLDAVVKSVMVTRLKKPNQRRREYHQRCGREYEKGSVN
jgi:hypothetical protein